MTDINLADVTVHIDENVDHDARERIQDERNMLVAELERRFAIIRQKMEQ